MGGAVGGAYASRDIFEERRTWWENQRHAQGARWQNGNGEERQRLVRCAGLRRIVGLVEQFEEVEEMCQGFIFRLTALRSWLIRCECYKVRCAVSAFGCLSNWERVSSFREATVIS